MFAIDITGMAEKKKFFFEWLPENSILNIVYSLRSVSDKTAKFLVHI